MAGKTLISFDYAIKYLLKDRSGYEIVEGFISSLLQSEGYGPVKIKTLLESESNREEGCLKKSVADVVVEDEQGNNYIVEIERSFTETFIHKVGFTRNRSNPETTDLGSPCYKRNLFTRQLFKATLRRTLRRDLSMKIFFRI